MPDPELSPQEVTEEIARILAAGEARRAAQKAKGKECIRRSLEKRLEQYKCGQIVMCDCTRCLTVYITRTGPDRMCGKGQKEFWRDTWQPWVQ